MAQTGKNPPAKQETVGSIPGLGRCPREGNGYPLQYSCLENSMDRGAWLSTVHGVAKSDMTVTHTHTHTHTVGRAFPPPRPCPTWKQSRKQEAPDVLLEQLPTSPRDVCLLPEEERSPWRLGLRAALVANRSLTYRPAGLFLSETSHRPGSARCSGAWCRCSRRWCRPRGSCSHRPSRLRPPRAPGHWRSRPRRPGPSARTSGSSRLAS